MYKKFIKLVLILIMVGAAILYALPYYPLNLSEPTTESKNDYFDLLSQNVYNCGMFEHSYINCLRQNPTFVKIESEPLKYYQALLTVLQEKPIRSSQFVVLIRTMDRLPAGDRADLMMKIIDLLAEKRIVFTDARPYDSWQEQFEDLSRKTLFPEDYSGVSVKWLFWHPKVKRGYQNISNKYNFLKDSTNSLSWEFFSPNQDGA